MTVGVHNGAKKPRHDEPRHEIHIEGEHPHESMAAASYDLKAIMATKAW
jgi:hypothetical protein